MAIIRPSDLPPAASVSAGNSIVVDTGSAVEKATPEQVVDAAIPLASQAEAEAGTDNAKRVTPLRVKQAIEALGVSAVNLASADTAKGASLVGTGNRWSAPYFSALDALVGAQDANVLWWIPRAEWAAIQDNSSTTDHSTYIQAAIDALNAAGGGTLKFPDGRYNACVVLKSGVSLIGADAHPSATVANARRVSWYATASSPCVDTPAPPGSGTSIEGASIKGFQFNGEHGTWAATGIRVRSARKFFIRDCAFNNFSGSAVLQDSPGAWVNGTLSIRDCFAQNCLKDNAGLVAYQGVFDLRGSDGLVDWVESTGSLSAMSATGFVAAFVFGGGDWKASNVLGEFADVNFYFPSGCERFKGVNLTSDYSLGHAYLLDGCVDCTIHGLAKRTGQETTNTYDSVHVMGSAARNNVAVRTVDLPATAIKARYAVYDGYSTTTKENRNDFSGCSAKSGSTASAAFNSNSLTGGSAMPVEIGAAIPVTGATPDVNGVGLIRHTGGVAVTNFTNGTAGQEFTFLAGADVTITRGAATIETMGKANKYLRSGHACRFRNYNGVWYEVGGDSCINSSQTWNPASLATGASEAKVFTVTGAVLGDFAEVAFSISLAGFGYSAKVTAADTVEVIITNLTAANPTDLGTITCALKVTKKG